MLYLGITNNSIESWFRETNVQFLIPPEQLRSAREEETPPGSPQGIENGIKLDPVCQQLTNQLQLGHSMPIQQMAHAQPSQIYL